MEQIIQKDAIKIVKELAKALNTKIHVMTSLSGWVHLDVKMVNELEDNLEQIRDLLEKEKILCGTHLLIRGKNLGDDIINIANKYKVYKIIIGTDRNSRIEKFMAGWYVNHVIDRVKCPVLVA